MKSHSLIILIFVWLVSLTLAQDRPTPSRAVPNPNDSKPQQPAGTKTYQWPQVPVPNQIASELAASAAKDCPEYAGSKGAKKFAGTLTAHSVDLNQNGASALVITAENECTQGASRTSAVCATWIYGKFGDKYSPLLNTGCAASVMTARTVSNGYKDLMTEEQLAPNETFVSIYKWDGNKYFPADCTIHKRIPNRFGRPIYSNMRVNCETRQLNRP